MGTAGCHAMSVLLSHKSRLLREVVSLSQTTTREWKNAGRQHYTVRSFRISRKIKVGLNVSKNR